MLREFAPGSQLEQGTEDGPTSLDGTSDEN
jgi:hypothetical protein